MIERHIIIDNVDPVTFYGVNNSNIQLIRNLFPKLRMAARGSVIAVIGDDAETADFEEKIHALADYCATYNTLPEDVIIDTIKGTPPKPLKMDDVIVYGDQPSTTAFFELSQSGSKVCVKGDSWVSIATGVNWYLKHYCGIHITWNNPAAKLPATLPRVEKPERHETSLTLRYDFNYCTFSYTMAFWDWERWQQEIDWMALHGVNLPLAVVGEECVWRNMLLKMGYSKQEVNDFIAGPAFLAWWEMNNLEGWGGPLPDAWYRQQEVLQKKILKRMKEWGMEPVLFYCGNNNFII